MNEVQHIDIQAIRDKFPILQQKINGKQLVYFDNAATTQKPIQVIEALQAYYQGYNANIHRGIHTLAEKATAAYEDTRNTVRDFLNANESAEVIFTKGTTDSINLVANAYGELLKTGDEIIISAMEHHSNIVPWQMLCEKKGLKLRIAPINDHGELLFEEFKKLLNEKTALVAITYASNSLGTINPVKEIINLSHEYNAVVLLDGAQASSHLEIDVQSLDVDFYAFSGHKVYGPTGVGVLYGKRALLEKMPPYQGGGEMIKDVSFEKTTYNEIPYKFEAGTPNIADVIALKEAIHFINEIGKEHIHAYEQSLLEYATTAIKQIEGVRVIGEAKEKVSVLSFIIEGAHHQDLGILLDHQGIAIRTGHHCTQPLMSRFGIPGTSRASFAVYNTIEEINLFITALDKALKMLR